MKKQSIWCFARRESAQACADLLSRGDNVESYSIEPDVDEVTTFDLFIETDDPSWFRGFACAFARLTPGESDLE